MLLPSPSSPRLQSTGTTDAGTTIVIKIARPYLGAMSERRAMNYSGQSRNESGTRVVIGSVKERGGVAPATYGYNRVRKEWS